MTPVFVSGIELYLSEPVNEDFLGSLVALWNYLKGIEELRGLATLGSKGARDQLPKTAELARRALPLATETCQKVDAALERMKPLE